VGTGNLCEIAAFDPSLWQQTVNDTLAMQQQGIDRTAILNALGYLGVTVELKAATP